MIEQLRRQKDDYFRSHPQSPLTPAQKHLFAGLSYYPYNPELDLEVEVIPFEKPTDIQMQTTTGEIQWFRRYGEFTFDVDGKATRLTIFQATYGFFLPVVDTQAGIETYPAGRYMEPEAMGGNRMVIDLNRLYNPFCAYNDKWSCPITPAENRIDVAIRAGEMIPDERWLNSG